MTHIQRGLADAALVSESMHTLASHITDMLCVCVETVDGYEKQALDELALHNIHMDVH